MKLVKNRKILTQKTFEVIGIEKKTIKLTKSCQKKSFEKNVKLYKFHLKEIWPWCMIIAMIKTKTKKIPSKPLKPPYIVMVLSK
jgi:hypothetical protein